jgi:hypothetical protein
MTKNSEHRDLFPGALEMMILQSLRLKPMDGYALTKHIKQVSDDLLQINERSREVWQWPRLETLLQDLRFGLRMLWKDKGFTAIALLSLALGIGANTAIFSLVDTVLIKTLPVKNPEQLVVLERGDVPPGPMRTLSRAFYEQARARRETLAGVCTFETDPHVNVAVDGQAEVTKAQRVTGGFFAVLGVNPLLGRTITEEDDKYPVVVISHRYWRQRFAADPAIVGKSISLNGHPFTISGERSQSDFSKRNAGCARAHVYRSGFVIGGHSVRPCACVARDGRGFDAGAQRQFPQRRGRSAAGLAAPQLFSDIRLQLVVNGYRRTPASSSALVGGASEVEPHIERIRGVGGRETRCRRRVARPGAYSQGAKVEAPRNTPDATRGRRGALVNHGILLVG